METFARAVAKELMELPLTIPFRDVSAGLSSDPEPGAKAAGGNSFHYCIKITATYGLRAG